MRLSKHPHNYADPPEIISTGDGWRVRISGCDTFDPVNEMGCKQYRAFDVAQGLATREEAEAVLRQYLSLAAARLPQPLPFGYVFDGMSRLGSGDRAHVHGEAVEGRTKPLYAEPPLCPSAPTGLAFEIAAYGYNAGDDKTDDRVFWVYAQTEAQVQEVVTATEAQYRPLTDLDITQDADFTLPADADKLRTALLRFQLQGALEGLLPYAENEATSLSSHDDCEAEADKAWAAVEKARALVGQPSAPTGLAACVSCESTTGQSCNDKGCGHLEAGNGEPDQKTFTVFVRASNNTGTTYITTVEAADTEEAKRIGLAECQDEWGYPEDHLTVVGVAEGDVNILEWDDIE